MSDEPHIYGDDCLRGWEEGKTPKYLYVRFSKIVRCNDDPAPDWLIPPNDRMFKLTQSDRWSCLWEITTNGWHILFDLQFDPPNAILWLEHVPDGLVYFYDVVGTPIDEGFVYTNRNPGCVFFGPTEGGIATVTWTQEATDLLEALNIQRADDLFMEMRPLVDGNKVYKFCRLRDATNISIEFEPD